MLTKYKQYSEKWKAAIIANGKLQKNTSVEDGNAPHSRAPK